MMKHPKEDLGRSASGTKIPFRPDVEGLRALAIILVIVSHAGFSFLRSGFIGVDVFFVLSGYLITSLLIQEIGSTGRLNLVRFYARRARRLLPAAMLLVLVVCAVEAVVVSPYMQLRVLKAAAATIFYSSNLYFAHLGLHYFEQESATSPLLHTWSLAVEEQFYFIWPILLLALARVFKRRTAAILALTAIAAVSFAWCVRLTNIDPVPAFFELPTRVWEFCLGGLIAYLPVARLAQHRRICSWLGAIGLLALLVCAQFIHASAFPGYIAAIPALATIALLLAGSAAPVSLIPRLLSASPAQVLGGLSYSLYLWHWPALVIAQQLFPSGTIAIRLAAIGVAVVLAFVTHRIVENPIRYSPALISKSGLTLKLAALGAVLCACGLAGWRVGLNHSAQFHKFEQAAQDVPALYSHGCSPAIPDPKPRLCYFGATDNPQSTVVLFGDSHAAEWFPAVEQIADSEHWKLVTIVKPHCEALMLNDEISAQMERVCDEWRRFAIGQIQQLHPDLVLVSSASIHPVANGQLVTDVAVWQRAARGTFSALAQTGAKVRFIRDTPHADYNVLECLAQAEWDGRTHCPALISSAALYPEIYAAEVRGAAGLNDVGFIDLSDAICASGQCNLEIGGTVVYRDMDHLTATYNRSLAGLLLQRINDSSRQ
jgi:peptidoglycan/LPS O-acetylase OafA/YrhL